VLPFFPIPLSWLPFRSTVPPILTGTFSPPTTPLLLGQEGLALTVFPIPRDLVRTEEKFLFSQVHATYLSLDFS